MNTHSLKKNYHHSIFVFLLCIILSFVFVTMSFASTNVKGFSVYRQGNFPNPSGHAGLVNSSNIEATDAIIHIIRGDENYLTRKTSLDSFIDDQDFYGYYVPEDLKNLSIADRTNKLASVIAKAQTIATINKNSLGYNLTYQVWYSSDRNNNKIVDVTEISSMRCDGLVEYCYEYYGLSVYGGDISKFDTSIRNSHSAPNITPKQQIKHYLKICLGDIDGDLNVTANDARLAMRYSTDLETFDSYQKFVADVDGNNNITAADAQLILQHSTQTISYFPADPFPPS